MQKSLMAGHCFTSSPGRISATQGDPNQFEQRFNYTSLIELPAYHVVYRIVKDGMSLPPGKGITELCERDRKFAVKGC